MKFLHLSDLHIGVRLLARDLKEDQEHAFGQIVDIARGEQVDAVVIAGDVYDRAVPSAEAVELFDRLMLDLSGAVPGAEIMVISGNHDSAERLNLFRGILHRQHVHMVGKPPEKPGDRIERVRVRDAYGEVCFFLLPFVRPSMVRLITGGREDGSAMSYDEAVRALLAREEIDPGARNVLVSHQFYLPAGMSADGVSRADSEIVTVGNIDQVGADALAPFDYAALGHIHRPMCVGSGVWRYCGTPAAYSVSEAGQQKQAVLVEMRDKGSVEVRTVPLRPLRDMRVIEGSAGEILSQACDDYVSLRVTDPGTYPLADLNDRFRAAFPYLLEVRYAFGGDAGRTELRRTGVRDPLDLCARFLGEADDVTLSLVRDVINTVKEGGTDAAD